MTRLRRFYWRRVRRYAYEICDKCGRPVGRTTGGSYWVTDDRLWRQIYGTDVGLRCISCFTVDCRESGVDLHWLAVRGLK